MKSKITFLMLGLTTFALSVVIFRPAIAQTENERTCLIDRSYHIVYADEITSMTNPSCAIIIGDLSGVNLTNADLSGANLTLANLYGANLTNATLLGASLFRVNLSGANLTLANLSGADLRNANLSGANLTSATMPNGELWIASMDMNQFTNPPQ